jgi:hypothetical protein
MEFHMYHVRFRKKHVSQKPILYCFLPIYFRRNLFIEPLSSNERLLWLRYSCFQASCHIIVVVEQSMSVLILTDLNIFTPPPPE